MLRTLLVLTLCTASASAALARDTVLPAATVLLRVGADGAPTGVACSPTTSPELCPVLVRAVSRWVFTPALRDGAPVAVDVSLRLPLVAVKQPQGFAIKATGAVVSLRNGEGGVTFESRHHSPPRYPVEELRARRTATVALEVSRDVSSLHPTIDRVWVNGRDARARDPFVEASRAAVMAWELAPWAAEQLSACMTIEYSTDKPTGQVSGTQSPDTRPCVPRYVQGFEPPALVTDPLQATF